MRFPQLYFTYNLLDIAEEWRIVCDKEVSTMSREFSITLDGGFELGDADAFTTVASRILGEKKYDEIRRQTIAFPKGVVNDRMVDEVMKVLNRPLVRIAMRMSQ